MKVSQLDEANLGKFSTETLLLYTYYGEKTFEVTIGRLEMIMDLYLSNLKNERTPDFKLLYKRIKEMNIEKNILWMVEQKSSLLTRHKDYIKSILIDSEFSRSSFICKELNETENRETLLALFK